MPKVIAQPELSLDDDLKGDPFLKDKMRVEHGVQIMGVPEFLALLA